MVTRYVMVTVNELTSAISQFCSISIILKPAANCNFEWFHYSVAIFQTQMYTEICSSTWNTTSQHHN